jgi:predicted metal-dependent phosphoesterase TrpH
VAGEGSPAAGNGRWAAHEQHAEELVDRFASRVVETAVRTAARAREEAEDLLAEARQHRRSGPPEG